jgi:hypothetical protein
MFMPISLRRLALSLARTQKIELADAQCIVYAAARRVAKSNPEPGSGEWLRMQFGGAPAPAARPSPQPARKVSPSLRDLAIAYARQHKIELADAQCIVYAAAGRFSST